MEDQEKDVWFAKVRPCVKNAMGREIIANAVERANAVNATEIVRRNVACAMVPISVVIVGEME